MSETVMPKTKLKGVSKNKTTITDDNSARNIGARNSGENFNLYVQWEY